MAPKRKVAAKPATEGAEEAVEIHNEEQPTTTTEEAPVAVAPAADAAASQATQEESPNAEAVAEAPAAAAEEEAPYTPLPVSGSTTEIYSQLQTILAADGTKVNYYLPQLLELVHASESMETPILMRVRFVEFVGNHVSQVRDNNALRKVVTSLVKIISGEDNTPQLLTAAVQAFAGLGPVSVVDKNWEYLAREGADVVMQVMIDREAFPESVRVAAAKSLNSLAHSAFRSVLAKLFHWLSLDREDDDEEQIQRERRLALTRLSFLVSAPSQRKHWTEETEKFAEALLLRVLGTVDRREFGQLVRICASLPQNKSQGNVPLLTWFVSTHKLDEARNVEALCLIGRQVSNTAEYDLTPALEAAGLLSHGVNATEDSSVDVAKAIYLASRIATAEGAEKLFTYVYGQVAEMVADMRTTLTSSNLITVEALLFAAVAVARKKSVEVLQKLNDEAFNASVVAAAQAAATVSNEVVFAVKKAAANKEANETEANAVASLANIKAILEAFAAKRLPLGEMHESWTRGHNPVPTAKRSRDGPRSAMPPPPGSHAAEVAAKNRSHTPHQQDRKRQRHDHGDRNRSSSSNNRNNNNSGNSRNNNNSGRSGNNNNGNGNGNNRSQSRTDRRPRRDSRR